MTRPPSAGPGRQPLDPGYFSRPGRGFRLAGIPVTLTPGAYLLGVLAAGFGAFTLLALDPGRSLAGYLAAAAGVVVVLLASMVAHELAHSIMARRYGLSVPVTVGLFGGVRHGRARRPGSAAEQEPPGPGAQWRGGAGGPPGRPPLGPGAAGPPGRGAPAGRRPAGRRRGRGSGLGQRPAGRGQPGSGGGTGWRADRPSARVGALGRSHPRGSHRRPLRPGQRRHPGRRRGDRAGAGSPDRSLVRADRPAHGRGVPG